MGAIYTPPHAPRMFAPASVVPGVGTEAEARAIMVRGGLWKTRGRESSEEVTPEGKAGEWPRPRGTHSFQDSGCLTSSFLAETLSHVRPRVDELSQGPGTQLQGDGDAPRPGLLPAPEIACSGPTARRAWGSKAEEGGGGRGEGTRTTTNPRGCSRHIL